MKPPWWSLPATAAACLRAWWRLGLGVLAASEATGPDDPLATPEITPSAPATTVLEPALAGAWPLEPEEPLESEEPEDPEDDGTEGSDGWGIGAGTEGAGTDGTVTEGTVTVGTGTGVETEGVETVGGVTARSRTRA